MFFENDGTTHSQYEKMNKYVFTSVKLHSSYYFSISTILMNHPSQILRHFMKTRCFIEKMSTLNFSASFSQLFICVETIFGSNANQVFIAIG